MHSKHRQLPASVWTLTNARHVPESDGHRVHTTPKHSTSTTGGMIAMKAAMQNYNTKTIGKDLIMWHTLSPPQLQGSQVDFDSHLNHRSDISTIEKHVVHRTSSVTRLINILRPFATSNSILGLDDKSLPFWRQESSGNIPFLAIHAIHDGPMNMR